MVKRAWLMTINEHFDAARKRAQRAACNARCTQRGQRTCVDVDGSRRNPPHTKGVADTPRY